ncbi:MULTISPECIES: hypothetical protein [unclassified Treponema]|uniref:hypothetical protein n=1 Tax=unclassified Treponema TaxID=2638727 RepID=UPI000E8622CC|nr:MULTISPECIES: hypothetical protein [unclassified Treponema]HBP10222.1 hypothetical protein [Treponema sp.]
MNFQNYKELLISSLSQNYKIDSFYLGEEYDIAGTLSKNDDGFEQKEACLVSFCNDENFVLSELQRLPEITLSGADGFSRNRRSVVLRVFVMQDVSFELAKKIRAFNFSRAKKSQFWSYVESQVVLVDLKNCCTYSNLSGEEKRKLFKFTEN